jgi:hypothetical protein
MLIKKNPSAMGVSTLYIRKKSTTAIKVGKAKHNIPAVIVKEYGIFLKNVTTHKTV